MRSSTIRRLIYSPAIPKWNIMLFINTNNNESQYPASLAGIMYPHEAGVFLHSKTNKF